MEHNLPFDPTYGYTLEGLLKVEAPEGPRDFAEFWRATYEEARAIPLHVARRAVDSPNPNYELYEVEFDSLGGARIGAWLTVPKGGKVRRGAVVGHGYGGRQAPDFALPLSDCAAILPCARGFHRSASNGFPNNATEHVVHGIESRADYTHRGCAADWWAAASALLELVPEAGRELLYLGASFGGGIGALALPWDGRFVRAFLDVPSFGNHPLRVGLTCTGSGDAVSRRYRAEPRVLDVLRYFDSATAARHIRIPTYVAAARFDPAVPPPGQFAVYNGIAATKRLFVRQAAHFDFAGMGEEERRLREELREWFA